MNPRIKKLVDQARKYAEDQQNDPLKIYTLDCFTEKFAELLIRDCAKLADIAEPYRSQDVILDYYGVKHETTI